MQESLLNTVKRMQQEEKIKVEELEILLDSSLEELVSLCKKACLKPKTDNMGNAYFSRQDVDILKKMKELYTESKHLQEKEETSSVSMLENIHSNNDFEIDNPAKKINFLRKAKERIKKEELAPINPINSIHPVVQLNNKIENLEKTIISRMQEILSEKMDGFDEIIVELIRTKTENENLRQQVNNLNKQVFTLKNELTSFSPVAFGFYTKKDNNEL